MTRKMKCTIGRYSNRKNEKGCGGNLKEIKIYTNLQKGILVEGEFKDFVIRYVCERCGAMYSREENKYELYQMIEEDYYKKEVFGVFLDKEKIHTKKLQGDEYKRKYYDNITKELLALIKERIRRKPATIIIIPREGNRVYTVRRIETLPIKTIIEREGKYGKLHSLVIRVDR